MANIPATLISAPPVPPVPPGLFDVALGPMEFPTAESRAGGLIYVPDTCVDDYGLYALNCPPVADSKAFYGVDTPVSGAPFAVYTSYTCGPVGYTLQEAEQRVLTRMLLREQRAVERRIWAGWSGGGLTTIPSLFAGATVLPAASCPVEAMRSLEQALSDNGVVGGLIHARTGMASYLANNYQIIYRTDRIFGTPRGNTFVFGDGYTGVGPSGQGATSTTEWMYATGRVALWTEPDVHVPNPGQTFDRTANQMYILAERIWAAAIECGVWAIQVTRDCTTT